MVECYLEVSNGFREKRILPRTNGSMRFEVSSVIKECRVISRKQFLARMSNATRILDSCATLESRECSEGPHFTDSGPRGDGGEPSLNIKASEVALESQVPRCCHEDESDLQKCNHPHELTSTFYPPFGTCLGALPPSALTPTPPYYSGCSVDMI
jgi:hypothetical protein